MPCSTVQMFSDPDEYMASIRATTAKLSVVERGQFTAKLVKIDLHQLWMQQLSEKLPRIVHSTFITGRAIVTFGMHPRRSLLWSGAEMQPTNIMRHNEGESAFQQSFGSACFGAMSLPVAEIAVLGATIAGCDLMPPRDMLIMTPAPDAMARLRRLHAAAAHLAEQAPEIIANVEAARGLEQELIEAFVACIRTGEKAEDSSARRRHSAIMRRFYRAVEESPDHPLYISELCRTIGTSGSTLRVCCEEQLGMSPKRYLMLRRMQLARQALSTAVADEITVTDIAMRYGFWQLGRFAVDYRSLFGETPSATLRCPPK